MKRFVFAFVGTLLLPTSAVYAQDDCTQVPSSLEMVSCSESAKKSADENGDRPRFNNDLKNVVWPRFPL